MIILFLLLDGTHIDVTGIITKALITICVGLVIFLIKVRHEDKKETAKKINQSKLDYTILNTQIEEWKKYGDKKETEYSATLVEIKDSLKTLVTDVTELKVAFASFKGQVKKA